MEVLSKSWQYEIILFNKKKPTNITFFSPNILINKITKKVPKIWFCPNIIKFLVFGIIKTQHNPPTDPTTHCLTGCAHNPRTKQIKK